MEFTVLMGYVSEWLGIFALAWLLSLSPRFQKPEIGFKYARRDGVMALSLYALILLFAFVYYQINPPIFPNPMRFAPAPVQDLGQALLVALLCLSAFIVSILVRRQPLAKSIGWNTAILTPALQFGVAAAVLTIFLHNRVMDVLSGVDAARGQALLLALGIGLAEETFFRGYIQLRLGWWLGPWAGIGLTALMFTFWHLPAWLHGLPFETILILAGLTLAQGLISGWVMYKIRNAAAPAIYRAFNIWASFFA